MARKGRQAAIRSSHQNNSVESPVKTAAGNADDAAGAEQARSAQDGTAVSSTAAPTQPAGATSQAAGLRTQRKEPVHRLRKIINNRRQRLRNLHTGQFCLKLLNELVPHEILEEVKQQLQAGTAPLLAVEQVTQKQLGRLAAKDVSKTFVVLAACSSTGCALTHITKGLLQLVARPLHLRGPVGFMTGVLMPTGLYGTLFGGYLAVQTVKGAMKELATAKETPTKGGSTSSGLDQHANGVHLQPAAAGKPAEQQGTDITASSQAGSTATAARQPQDHQQQHQQRHQPWWAVWKRQHKPQVKLEYQGNQQQQPPQQHTQRHHQQHQQGQQQQPQPAVQKPDNSQGQPNQQDGQEQQKQQQQQVVWPSKDNTAAGVSMPATLMLHAVAEPARAATITASSGRNSNDTPQSDSPHSNGGNAQGLQAAQHQQQQLLDDSDFVLCRPQPLPAVGGKEQSPLRQRYPAGWLQAEQHSEPGRIPSWQGDDQAQPQQTSQKQGGHISGLPSNWQHGKGATYDSGEAAAAAGVADEHDYYDDMDSGEQSEHLISPSHLQQSGTWGHANGGMLRHHAQLGNRYLSTIMTEYPEDVSLLRHVSPINGSNSVDALQRAKIAAGDYSSPGAAAAAVSSGSPKHELDGQVERLQRRWSSGAHEDLTDSLGRVRSRYLLQPFRPPVFSRLPSGKGGCKITAAAAAATDEEHKGTLRSAASMDLGAKTSTNSMDLGTREEEGHQQGQQQGQ